MKLKEKINVPISLDSPTAGELDKNNLEKMFALLKQEFNNHEIESIVKETVGKTALVQKMTGGTSSVTITTDVMSEEESAI